ncbi:TetR/AcrR family transcriptional regulator [Streptomyces sp. WAC06614]|uniref:TetR/AcrR family transcriptional regulator n=1 Tax=Streptomyces sp. WAC06614 TaxID=2487416 RepID=UPI000F7A2693|nr:TetR/AcrR family transcriptional regulator [Streptomyces sp. WAC06614]RSS81048.1 TetR/AcrR family transcriptional regulator [Streptomyces sp. WAC06614]
MASEPEARKPEEAAEAGAAAADGQDGTGLPASLETAWGLRTRRPKGPRPALTLDRIVGAAVRLAATEGIAAVSMGRVAKELGVSTMSLYRYVAAKDELYVLMADAGVGTPPPLDPDAATARPGWRAALTDWAYQQRAVLQANTWVLRIPITGPPASPNQVAWMERGLAALAETGLREGQKLSVLMLIGGLVRNEATLMADMTDAIVTSGISPDQMLARYTAVLTALTDPERHPAVTRLLASGELGHADGPDTEFAFGLDRILDGLDALIAARRGPVRESP